MFADIHGTSTTYRNEQQSVGRYPLHGCLAILAHLQTQMGPSSLTNTSSSSQLTDICASTSGSLLIVVSCLNLVPTVWLSQSWLLSTLYSFTGWLLLHL